MKIERHPYIGNPYGFKLPEPKPVIHPIINKWDDFLDEDKLIISNIKKLIVSKLGDCKVSIFGSRIRGKWTDKSDYDILIYKMLSKELLDSIKEINYGVKADISFCDENFFEIGFNIEIH